MFRFILSLFKLGWEHDNYIKKRNKMDNNPMCTIKSDTWKRKYGLIK